MGEESSLGSLVAGSLLGTASSLAWSVVLGIFLAGPASITLAVLSAGALIGALIGVVMRRSGRRVPFEQLIARTMAQPHRGPSRP
jgi:hypothetical protein